MPDAAVGYAQPAGRSSSTARPVPGRVSTSPGACSSCRMRRTASPANARRAASRAPRRPLPSHRAVLRARPTRRDDPRGDETLTRQFRFALGLRAEIFRPLAAAAARHEAVSTEAADRRARRDLQDPTSGRMASPESPSMSLTPAAPARAPRVLLASPAAARPSGPSGWRRPRSPGRVLVDGGRSPGLGRVHARRGHRRRLRSAPLRSDGTFSGREGARSAASGSGSRATPERTGDPSSTGSSTAIRGPTASTGHPAGAIRPRSTSTFAERTTRHAPRAGLDLATPGAATMTSRPRPTPDGSTASGPSRPRRPPRRRGRSTSTGPPTGSPRRSPTRGATRLGRHRGPRGATSRGVEALLRDVFHFHPLAIEDALKETHVPKVDDWGDYLYLVFHSIDFDPETDDLRLHELDIFLGRNYLVTYHNEPLAVLEQHPPEHRARPGQPAPARGRPPALSLPRPGASPTTCRRSSTSTRRSTTPRTRSSTRPTPADPPDDLPGQARRPAAPPDPRPRARGPQPPGPRRLRPDRRAEHRVYFRDVYDHLVRSTTSPRASAT